MKKLNNSKFGENSVRSIPEIRWEKIQADGKWLWIFKRGAIWVTICLFLYGLGALIYPAFFNFQITQFYILLGMLGGFVLNSILEWTKLENQFQEIKIAKK